MFLKHYVVRSIHSKGGTFSLGWCAYGAKHPSPHPLRIMAIPQQKDQ